VEMHMIWKTLLHYQFTSFIVLLTQTAYDTSSAGNIQSRSGVLILVMWSQETWQTLWSKAHRACYFAETFLSDIISVWEETKVSHTNA